MIVATYYGGPKDGEIVALESHGPVLHAIHRPPTASFLNESDPLTTPSFDTITIQPRLTRRGWILEWPRGT
jgi:hypothetical protein